jgi:hypothetical protein
MIIDYADVRAVRPIAENLPEEKRLRPYIEEAETLWLLPALGAALYKHISEHKDDYALLFSGGYYDGDNRCFSGLSAAMGYLSYSLFVRNQNVNITAFGITVKRGEFSEPADDKTIVRIANDAEKIGKEYLNRCVEYLKYTGALKCKTKQISHVKIQIIGD